MRFIKKHKIVFSILVIALVLIIGSAAAGGAFVWSKLDLLQSGSEIESTDPNSYVEPESDAEDAPDVLTEADMEGLEKVESGPELPTDLDLATSEDVLNVLLIGTDERTKQFNTNARSDSMMLLSLNTKNHTAKLVSLERGIGVPVLSGVYEGQYDWLTHIFRYGGADLLMETVRTCFNVDVDRYVRVNFNTVRQMVDSIGGVDINLTDREAAHLSEMYAKRGRKFSPGVNHLSGDVALDYSRIRKIDSDWKRVQRQRNVIQAAVNATKDLSLSGVIKLADEVLPLIQTNFTKMEISSLVMEAPGFLGCQIEQMTIPAKGTYGSMIGMGGRHLFAIDFEANSKILHDFLYDAAPAPSAEPSAESTTEPTAEP